MSRLQNLSPSFPPRTSERTPVQPSPASRLLPVTRVLQLSTLWEDESGQDLIEYALVAALVGLAAVAAMRGLSTKISGAFNSVGSNLTSAV